MKPGQIAQWRLANQHIGASSFKTAGEVVRRLGALQAQDYAGAKWSLGARLPGLTEALVERAVDCAEIIRTWALRGTWHWVSPADVHWMLRFVAPRIHQKYAKNLHAEGFDKSNIRRAHAALIKALEGGNTLTREELSDIFVRKGIKTTNYGMGHLLLHASQERLICMGPRRGKQFTHVLLDEWVPTTSRYTPDDPLAELARRYFTSHGPATARDFMWWAGISLTEARRSIELVQNELGKTAFDGEWYWHGAELPDAPKSGVVQLLPGFDELLLGYTDRSAMVKADHKHRLAMTANGQYSATIMAGGQVVGSWRRTIGSKEVTIETEFFDRPTKAVVTAMQAAAKRYGKFLGLKPVL